MLSRRVDCVHCGLAIFLSAQADYCAVIKADASEIFHGQISVMEKQAAQRDEVADNKRILPGVDLKNLFSGLYSPLLHCVQGLAVREFELFGLAEPMGIFIAEPLSQFILGAAVPVGDEDFVESLVDYDSGAGNPA